MQVIQFHLKHKVQLLINCIMQQVGVLLEYNQLFMYSQLYVESTQDHQQRLNGLRQVVNRTYRIGTTKRVEVSQGNVQTKRY